MISPLLAYAFVLGMLALLNPCGFALLPTYLALFVRMGDAPDVPRRIVSSVRTGIALTLGFVAVFAAVGVVFDAVRVLTERVTPWLMLVCGVMIILVGAAGLTRLSGRWHLPALRVSASRSFWAVSAFGAAYAIGSLSCTLPLFLAVAAGSLDVSPPLTLATIVAYALGMASLACALSLAVSLGGAIVARLLRRVGAHLPLVGNVLCIITGAYLATIAVAELLGSTSRGLVTAALSFVQNGTVAALDPVALPLGIVLAGSICGALITAAVSQTRTIVPRHRSRRSTDAASR